MNTLRKYLLRATAAWLLLVSSSQGQTSTTSLQGTVTDPSGSAVANARVELTNLDSKAARETTTDSQGDYRFQFLPPGTYSLSVSAAGFSRFEQ